MTTCVKISLHPAKPIGKYGAVIDILHCTSRGWQITYVTPIQSRVNGLALLAPNRQLINYLLFLLVDIDLM